MRVHLRCDEIDLAFECLARERRDAQLNRLIELQQAEETLGHIHFDLHWVQVHEHPQRRVLLDDLPDAHAARAHDAGERGVNLCVLQLALPHRERGLHGLEARRELVELLLGNGLVAQELLRAVVVDLAEFQVHLRLGERGGEP